ncbi:hypothetical protein NUW54_g11696 [Trametes sanguinea]|uniref:Uncharacterized protein n=1 Tax=Trametes sanguinea TaxID=158606 RepID=A0ACC1NB26_9APHY|nr:hypothetical protein NUW54_g11696 [Trametes sanguinea]
MRLIGGAGLEVIAKFAESILDWYDRGGVCSKAKTKMKAERKQMQERRRSRPNFQPQGMADRHRCIDAPPQGHPGAEDKAYVCATYNIRPATAEGSSAAEGIRPQDEERTKGRKRRVGRSGSE